MGHTRVVLLLGVILGYIAYTSYEYDSGYRYLLTVACRCCAPGAGSCLTPISVEADEQGKLSITEFGSGLL